MAFSWSSFQVPRFLEELSKASASIGGLLSDARLCSGNRSVNELLEECRRDVWINKRLQTAESSLRRLLADTTLAQSCAIQYLRATLLFAEAQFVRLLRCQSTEDMDECLSRYDTLLATIQRLSGSVCGGVDAAEVLVCECEALGVVGALQLMKRNVVHGVAMLRRSRQGLAKAKRVLAAAMDDPFNASQQHSRAPHAHRPVYQQPSPALRAAMTRDLKRVIEEKTRLIRDWGDGSMEKLRYTSKIPPELFEISQDLIKLKLFYKSVTGGWVSSDNHMDVKAWDGELDDDDEDHENNQQQGVCAHTHTRVYTNGVQGQDTTPGASHCFTRGRSARGKSMTQSSAWCPSERIKFASCLLSLAPTILPPALSWTWRFVLADGTSPPTLSTLQDELRACCETDSLRSPLAYTVMRRVDQMVVGRREGVCDENGGCTHTHENGVYAHTQVCVEGEGGRGGESVSAVRELEDACARLVVAESVIEKEQEHRQGATEFWRPLEF